MCIFITVVAKSADKDVVLKALVSNGRRADVVNNTCLQTAMSDDEIQFLSTNGHCDCDTVLGRDDQDDSIRLRSKEIARLKRKKWSVSKIDRYFLDRDKTANKRDIRRSDSLELWEKVISDALKGGASGIGLFFHMYRGEVTGEKMNVTARKADFITSKKDALKTAVEDELLYF